jgi:RNA recognition motif-containing protein
VKKLFVGSLPPTTTEESLRDLFSQYGTVRSLDLKKDIFSGRCRGIGFLEMEGHEARAAIAGLDGKSFEGNQALRDTVVRHTFIQSILHGVAIQSR